MSYVDTTWYVNAGDQAATGYWAVVKRQPSAAVVAGQIVRQFSVPAIEKERCFVCIVAGTSSSATDATWVLTRGAKTIDGTVTWQECTGAAAVNGDVTNTPDWTVVKGEVVSLGQIVKRTSGASFQICSTAGTTGTGGEPGFSNTAGVTTADGTAIWTSIGPVGNFTNGGAPHARLNGALASGWFAGENTIYVADIHAESTAGQNQIANGVSNSSVGKILCHKHAGSYPPAAEDITTGASITVTGAFAGLYFMPEGHYYIYGITFRDNKFGLVIGSSGAPAGGPCWYYFDTCRFEIDVSTPEGNIALGRSGGAQTCSVVFDNTTVKFGPGSPGGFHLGHTQFLWQNTPQIFAPGSAIPPIFFKPFPNQASTAMATLEGLDFTQVVDTLFSDARTTGGNESIVGYLLLKDCKSNPSMVIEPPVYSGFVVQLTRCGSTAQGRYRSERYAAEGVETTEDVITRVDGAVDPAGQRQSRKIIVSEAAEWLRPFQAEPYALWFTPAGLAPTITVYGATTGPLPANDEIWLEVEYLGSADSPLGTIFKTTKVNFWAAGTPVASDNSAWNGDGTLVKFKLVALLPTPPQLVGYMHVRVRAAKPDTTFYIDPQIVLS